MSLKSSNQVGTNRYQLEIAVDADVFEKAVDAAYHKENKKIMIPGFRKGKAPRAFVEKYYGANVFYDDAINAVYPDAMQQAVEEAKLEMIEDKIDFDLVSAGKEGLVFKATITTKPEVEIDGYKGVKAEKKPVSVKDADIDAEVEKIRERNSRMVTVEDRTAQNDDIAIIDFEGFVDGVPFEGGKGENHSLTLGAGQFIPGFEEQVVGHKSGEEFDINIKFPDEYQAKELAGKDSVFHIHLHEIKMKELPEVDDDFVKDVSEFNTLAEYKADIQEKLTKAKEQEAQDEVENQLIDKLAENLKAEIPPAMFENRINEDVRDFSYRLQSQGLNLETYMQYTGQNEEAIRGQFREQAERQVKVRLALEKIVELENIQPSAEEIENEYKKLAENYKMEADKVKSLISEKDLVKDLAVQKAVDFVRENAVITESKEEKSKASEKNDKKSAE